MAKDAQKKIEELKEIIKSEPQLREDEVIIKGEKVRIKPTKVRYLIGDRQYLNYTIIEKEGLLETLKYVNGYDILKSTLVAIFDNEEYVNSIIEDIDVELLEKIIKISKKVTRVKDEEEDLKNALKALEGGEALA